MSETTTFAGDRVNSNSSVRSNEGGEMDAVPGVGNINNFPGGVLQLYGSSSCGLNASGADIDLTIEPAGGAPSHDSQKAIVQELASILGCRSSWAQVAIVSSK